MIILMPMEIGSALLILAFTFMSGIDIYQEFETGQTPRHLLIEIVLALLAMGWSFYLWFKWWETSRKLASTHQALAGLSDENKHWRQENERLISGLSHSIDDQLTKWKLTPAEKEVALLLLKGLSFKEIAAIRSTSEKTTRQQSLTIYQKSSLPGRAELSAFFLEDLLDPHLKS